MPDQLNSSQLDTRARRWRLFRRNQAFGLLLVAGLILLWRLLHTNPAWLFPRGWWRF